MQDDLAEVKGLHSPASCWRCQVGKQQASLGKPASFFYDRACMMADNICRLSTRISAISFLLTYDGVDAAVSKPDGAAER